MTSWLRKDPLCLHVPGGKRIAGGFGSDLNKIIDDLNGTPAA